MDKLPNNTANLFSFQAIRQLIQNAKEHVAQQVNVTLIQLYWEIGAYISGQVDKAGWGQGVVNELADYLKVHEPNHTGFSARNLWRMKQFYETYKDNEELSTLLTVITWSNHLHILSKTKTVEERSFYLQLAAKHPYSARELARVIDSGTYERTLIANQKLSSAMTELSALPTDVFKDSYIFEFLSLPERHKEIDLKMLF